MSELLRLEADDPAVLELTGLALYDALEIADPPLHVVCKRCGALLGRGGDTPHGPLFTSSWSVNPSGYTVTVEGRELPYTTATRWAQDRMELLHRSGKPMRSPIRHCVRALVTPDLADYPDLLVRCGKHGDDVLDRGEVLHWIRQAAYKPIKRAVTLTQRDLKYRTPQHIPGPSASRQQSETWRYKFDSMTIEEYERRRNANLQRDTLP